MPPEGSGTLPGPVLVDFWWIWGRFWVDFGTIFVDLGVEFLAFLEIVDDFSSQVS